tara:strand:- start:161 stop:1210 length:1050 start_codon:yes stop_codon:yes gene_type:complete
MFLAKEQMGYWKNFADCKVIEHLMEKIHDDDSYFFCVSGRSISMLKYIFKLDYCLRNFGEDKIYISDPRKEGETFISRMDLVVMAVSACLQGYIPIETALRFALPDAWSASLVAGEPEESDEAFSICMGYMKFISKRLSFWWTGTSYRQDYKAINYMTDQLAVQVFAMLDLLRLNDSATPLMQTYDIKNQSLEKNKSFSVIHSPGLREGHKKGTDIIKDASKKLCNVQFNIYGKDNQISNEQILHEKTKSHVCIDKISDTCGGIGKSGIEAMISGVPTICSLQHTEAVGRYAGLPVIDVRNEECLIETLEKLRDDKEYYNKISKRTKEWSEVFSYESTVKYLDEVLFNE